MNTNKQWRRVLRRVIRQSRLKKNPENASGKEGRSEQKNAFGKEERSEQKNASEKEERSELRGRSQKDQRKENSEMNPLEQFSILSIKSQNPPENAPASIL